MHIGVIPSIPPVGFLGCDFLQTSFAVISSAFPQMPSRHLCHAPEFQSKEFRGRFISISSITDARVGALFYAISKKGYPRI